MKIILSLMLVILIGGIAGAQTRVISKGDYDSVFGSAVGATNTAFPFIFTVITDTYANGKVVSTETDIYERQAQGVERGTRKLIIGGKTLQSYSVMVGIGNNRYCSTDGTSWRGPQQYVCPGPDGSGLQRVYRARTPETAEYTVTERFLNGNAVKIYRESSVFASSEPNGKKVFDEKITTIDSRGFLIEIIGTEGTLDPRTVILTRKQTWSLNAKFPVVKAPR